MKEETGTIRSLDGMELFARHWLPEDEPKAHIAVVHGYGEHSGRYAPFADWMTTRGYAVHACDLRGHGRSPGKRGHVDRWQAFHGDAAALIAAIRARYGEDVPLFLFGHSMGGLIVLGYAIDYGADLGEGLRGLIASGPALAQGQGVPAWLYSLAKALAAIVPRLQMNSHLDASGLSHDESVVRAYLQDPLVHSLGTTRMASEMDREMKRVMALAGRWPVDVPLLILHGGADHFAPPESSARFFEAVAARDKRRIEYPGFYHEVINEIGREQVLRDITEWLELHLPD